MLGAIFERGTFFFLLIKDTALFQTQVMDDEDSLSVFLLMLSLHVQAKLNDLG